MIFNIYSVYDCKVGAYMRPMYLRTDDELFAAIYETAKDQNSGFYKYPEDYTVYFLGTFNEEDAKIDYVGPTTVDTVLNIRVIMNKKHLAAMRRLKMEALDESISVVPTGKKDFSENSGFPEKE